VSERARLAERIPHLRRRARLNQLTRAFFDERGFLEIEAPLLVPSPGLELHLDAFVVQEGAGRAPRYLITSPEYQMKRLLAAGLPRIYSLGKVFRRGEQGRQHNPEFTMLEWYRAHAGWQVIADDVEALVATLAEALNGSLRIGAVDLTPPWERRSVRAAFEEHAGVAVYGDESEGELRARLAVRHRLPAGGGWDDLFFAVFLDAVEPALGRARPVVLYDWPRPLCALAREKPGDPSVVERFEAYLAGLELCNGFGELTDAAEQRRRLERDLAERRRRALPEYPIDEAFLRALAEMPEASGVALGVDRLAMALFGVDDIREVLPFAATEL
jgi:lysyl-tRNA synthetase class 2